MRYLFEYQYYTILNFLKTPLNLPQGRPHLSFLSKQEISLFHALLDGLFIPAGFHLVI